MFQQTEKRKEKRRKGDDMRRYENLESVMKTRRATRQFDPNFHLTEADLHQLLEIAIEAPSTSNLQPWKFQLVLDEEMKERIRPIALNQSQVEDAAAVIAVFADTELEKNIIPLQEKMVKDGHMTEEEAKDKIARDEAYYGEKTARERHHLSLFDVGAVTMSLVLLAESKGIDSCIMGGFDQQAYREMFQIDERYEPVVLVALGKRKNEPRPTTRFPVKDLLLL